MDDENNNSHPTTTTTTTTTVSFFALPHDCRMHVLSFLSLLRGGAGTLVDVGLTCSRSLEDVTIHLIQRRQEQLLPLQATCAWLYQRVLPSRYSRRDLLGQLSQDLLLRVVPSCTTNDNHNNDYHGELRYCESRQSADHNHHDHPADLTDTDALHPPPQKQRQRQQQVVIKEFMAASSSHELYFRLVLGATGLSNMLFDSTNHNQSSFCISADEYLGDVLTTVYLLRSPSTEYLEREWIRRTGLLLRLSPLSASHWYRVWVLLHRYLLLFLMEPPPRPSDHHHHHQDDKDEDQEEYKELVRTLLGIPNNNHPGGSLSSLPPLSAAAATKSLQPPQSGSDFVRSDLLLFARTLRDNYAHLCSPRFHSRDFGVLGPTYRGRDNLLSWSVDTGVTATVLMNVLRHYYLDNDDDDGAIDRRRRLVNNDLQWIRKIHRYTFRNRPMTVDSPTVTFHATVG